MTSAAIEYRRLRAPQKHGELLVEPPLEQAAQTVFENRSRSDGFRIDFRGREFTDLAQQARQDLWRAALRYSRRYSDAGDASVNDPNSPILLTGHQPELFHPGVWIKNFAVSAMARRCAARAVHLIIDNDTVASATIKVPEGTCDQPRFGTVAYDQQARETPYEDRLVSDRSTFASFADRVQKRLLPCIADPLITSFWPRAVAAAEEQGNLGRAIAQARHELELDWGATSCELPLGQVCEQEVFRWFVVHLLGDVIRFRDTYNESLAEYRRVHRLRSRTHPVPELARQDDWLEVPFWLWSSDDPQRKRVFVRRRGRQMEISDQKQSLGFLSLHSDALGHTAVEELAAMSACGHRLRPRALMTTMFSRLFLGDLFVHGIGGAKYDQLTDQIIQRFFGITPPVFFVVTATAKLPIDRTVATPSDVRRLDHLLRELRFNPQRHVALDSETEPWLAAKAQWIAEEGASEDRRARHQEVDRINANLQPFVAQRRHELLRQRSDLVRRLRSDRVLGTREYAFCLFPEETLRPLLLDI